MERVEPRSGRGARRRGNQDTTGFRVELAAPASRGTSARAARTVLRSRERASVHITDRRQGKVRAQIWQTYYHQALPACHLHRHADSQTLRVSRRSTMSRDVARGQARHAAGVCVCRQTEQKLKLDTSKDQYIQLMIFSPCRWSCPAIRLVNASCVFWWDIVATIVC